MNYYIDITLIPDAGLRLSGLMNAVFSKLHKALCDLRSTTLGVSFPKVQITLGNILRIHGYESYLRDLQGLNWLDEMNGYCRVSEILLVPADTKYRTISRKQPAMSQSKLNRLLKRGSITEAKVNAYKVKMFAGKGLDNPYLDLVSVSSGQRYRRYIVFSELLDHPVTDEFDQCGFSKSATIPWFD